MNRYYQRWKNKTYFIPALYCLFAVIFSFAIIVLDRTLIHDIQMVNNPIFLQRIEAARSILSVLTGALLSMITVTFSTIMVVLTLYSGQFSPRTLPDFLESKVSLRVLGVFMGTFIYSITQMYFLPDPQDELSSIAGSIGVLLAILCLVLFAYFIHHIANSIQVNLMVERITKDILALISKKQMQKFRNKNKEITTELPDEYENYTFGESIKVKAKEGGYIQKVDNVALVDFASEHDCTIRLEQSLGDYITNDTTIFSLWGEALSSPIPEEDKEKLFLCLEIGEERNSEEDVEFGIIKLVEVALKAISPGINDPNTAIFCIQKIGYVLSNIAQARRHKTYYYGEENKLRLIVNKIPFKDLLYQSFSQIKHYGSHDHSVMGACVDALAFISKHSAKSIKEICWEFSLYLFEDCDCSKMASLDRLFLERKMQELAFVTRHLGESPFKKQEVSELTDAKQ